MFTNSVFLFGTHLSMYKRKCVHFELPFWDNFRHKFESVVHNEIVFRKIPLLKYTRRKSLMGCLTLISLMIDESGMTMGLRMEGYIDHLQNMNFPCFQLRKTIYCTCILHSCKNTLIHIYTNREKMYIHMN